MIDFAKLNNRTPEEKEADRAAVEAKCALLEIEDAKKIIDRKIKVAHLLHNIDTLSEKNAKYVKGLEYKSTTYGMTGQLGGALIELSDKQVSYLDDLFKQYVPAQEKNVVEIKPEVLLGNYSGKIMAIEAEQYVQKIGRDPDVVVRHDIGKLFGFLKVGGVVDIEYMDDGLGTVTERLIDLGR